MKLPAALLALSLVLAAPAAGQDTLRVTVRAATGQVTGRITSSISGQPLPFVLLSLDRPRRDFFSTEQGRFALTLDRGEYRVLVRQLGYRPLEVRIVAGEGPDVLDLTLEPRALVLPALVASA